MGKKANAEVFFTRASLVHWIQFASSKARDGEDWNLKKLGFVFQICPRYNPKMPKILKRIAFPGKIYLVLLLLVYKEYYFWIKYQESFSTRTPIATLPFNKPVYCIQEIWNLKVIKGYSLSYYREGSFFFNSNIHARIFCFLSCCFSSF